jgi:hypothetical protein
MGETDLIPRPRLRRNHQPRFVHQGPLIRLWLNARSEHRWRAYEADVGGTLATVGKPIASTTLADLQAGIEPFEKAPASSARKIGAAKPLLSFAERTGLLAFHIGGARAECRGAAKIQGAGRLTGRTVLPGASITILASGRVRRQVCREAELPALCLEHWPVVGSPIPDRLPGADE